MGGFVNVESGLLRFQAEVDGVPFLVTVRPGGVSLVQLPDGDRTLHDAFVTQHLGPPTSENREGLEWDYPWGTVGSYLHAQDQSPHIAITYT